MPQEQDKTMKIVLLLDEEGKEHLRRKLEKRRSGLKKQKQLLQELHQSIIEVAETAKRFFKNFFEDGEPEEQHDEQTEEQMNGSFVKLIDEHIGTVSRHLDSLEAGEDITITPHHKDVISTIALVLELGDSAE